MFLLADVVFFVWAPMAALFVIAYRRIVYGVALWRLYGPPGLLLLVFGRQMTWRAEAQVLARVDEEGNAQSLKFQQALKDECSMIAISGAIVAQIAITGLTLSNLDQVHWTARALLLFTLVASLTAVYYATSQHRAMGRLLTPSEVRAWIRGTQYREALFTDFRHFFLSFLREVGLLEYLDKIEGQRNLGTAANHGSMLKVFASLVAWFERRYYVAGRILVILLEFEQRQPCEPGDYLSTPTLQAGGIEHVLRDLARLCFTPSIASVMTISAPQTLLSSSLLSLLASLGVYFGGSDEDSRNIFVVYLGSIGVCFLAYSISPISQLLSGDSSRGVYETVRENATKYTQRNPNIIATWFPSQQI